MHEVDQEVVVYTLVTIFLFKFSHTLSHKQIITNFFNNFYVYYTFEGVCRVFTLRVY